MPAQPFRSLRVRTVLRMLAGLTLPIGCTLSSEGTGPTDSAGGAGPASASASTSSTVSSTAVSSSTGAGGGASSASAGPGGAGGGHACNPGETQPCYTGPDGTEGKGLCKGGVQTCEPDGSGFGPCEGEVTPQAEDCSSSGDENCDGQVDEGCPCVPGETKACYSGPGGTQGVGPCKAGTQTCNPDGMGYGPCEGEVTPQAEDCASAIDEDCDGVVFVDDNSGCVCEPGTTGDCYEGPPGTQGVGPCAAGTAVCDADGLGYGACDGQVLPQLEVCSSPIDEDCDGQVFDDGDDGCICQPASAIDCETGQPGVCAEGSKACSADGMSYGACLPKQPAGFEDCVDPLDQDCDGSALPCTGESVFLGKLVAENSDDVVFAVATDAAGYGAFGGLLLGATPGYQVTGGQAMLYRLKPDGSYHWGKPSGAPGGGGYAVIRGVGADSTGAVVAAGEFKGNINFGGGKLASGGSLSDGFVVKLNDAGGHLWTKAFGSNPGEEAALALAVGGDDAVYVTGRFRGTVTFDATPSLSSGTLDDVFVAKLDASGTAQWAVSFGDDGLQVARGIAVSPDGGVVVVGSMEGSFEVGGVTLESKGLTDVFVVKLDAADGSVKWAKAFGDALDQGAHAVAVDPAGNVVVAGAFTGKLDFGGGELVNANDAAHDAFVAKLDAMGGHVWSKRFGDESEQAAEAVATDPAGHVLVGGRFVSTIDFGGGALVNADAAKTGAFDAFVAKLTAQNGGHVWSRRGGDASGSQIAWAIAAEPNGRAFVGGGFQGTMDFGAPPPLTSKGAFDMYIAKLAP